MYDKFIVKLSKEKALEIKISEILDIDDSNFQCEETDIEDTLTILDKYIDESDFDLDKKISKQIIRDLYYEALEVE